MPVFVSSNRNIPWESSRTFSSTSSQTGALQKTRHTPQFWLQHACVSVWWSPRVGKWPPTVTSLLGVTLVCSAGCELSLSPLRTCCKPICKRWASFHVLHIPLQPRDPTRHPGYSANRISLVCVTVSYIFKTKTFKEMEALIFELFFTIFLFVCLLPEESVETLSLRSAQAVCPFGATGLQANQACSVVPAGRATTGPLPFHSWY